MTATTPFAAYPTSGNASAQFLADTVIALPLFREMTDEHFALIRSVLSSFRE
jgi:dTDP-4-amino-4,6-dideoxygalactose transaminase